MCPDKGQGLFFPHLPRGNVGEKRVWLCQTTARPKIRVTFYRVFQNNIFYKLPLLHFFLMAEPSRIERTTERLWRDRGTPNFAPHNLRTAYKIAKSLLDGLVPQGIVHAGYTPRDDLPDFSDVHVGTELLKKFIPVVAGTLAEAVSVFSRDHDRVGLDKLDELWRAHYNLKLLSNRPFVAPDDPVNLRYGSPPISHHHSALASFQCPIDGEQLILYTRKREPMQPPFRADSSPVPPSSYFCKAYVIDFSVYCADCHTPYAFVQANEGDKTETIRDVSPHFGPDEISFPGEMPLSASDLRWIAQRRIAALTDTALNPSVEEHYTNTGGCCSRHDILFWELTIPLERKLGKSHWDISPEERGSEAARILHNAAKRGFEVAVEYL